MLQRQTIARVVLGVLIVVCVLWCGRTGVRGYRLVTTLHALGINAIRLESVDTALAPGSRVEWDSATVATLRSRAWLRAADGHEHYDSAANRRWDALLSPIERDSARLSGRRASGRPIQDVPGIGEAVRVLTGAAPAALYVAELVAGADTTRLEREAAKLYAVVDSGSPVVMHIRTGRPAGAPRGELVMALPTVILPVY
jgi:hypothetical protein